MDRETLSFTEILGREKYILFDASITSYGDSDWYARHVYDVRSFSGIDADVLRREIGFLEETVSFLSNPNVYTVPGTISKFEKARNIVQVTRDFLNLRNEYNRKSHRHHSREAHPRGEIQKDLLKDIHDLFHDLSVQSKKSLLEPKKKDLYDILEKAVLTVTEETDSKIEFGPSYGDFSESKDFHTDEQLVAMALYLSLTGKENSIITRDSDIRRIFVHSLQYLLHPEARWWVGSLEEAIEKNRIVIYYTASPEQAEIYLNTSNFKIERDISSSRVWAINQNLKTQFPTIA